MRRASRGVGFSFGTLALGAGGAAGSPGTRVPPPPIDGGAGQPVPGNTDGGGTTCVADGAVVLPPIMGGGLQPQLPATITQATVAVPPLSGGTLLALADGTTVAASDPERDQVYLVATAAGTVTKVALQAGDEPGRLAQDAAGLLHVVLRRGGAIATIDPKTGTLGPGGSPTSRLVTRFTWPAQGASSSPCPRRAAPRPGP